MSDDKGNGKDDTTDGAGDDTTDGDGATLETVTVQKRKALEQRDEARTDKDTLQEEFDKYKEDNPLKDDKKDTNTDSNPSDLDSRFEKIEFAQAHPELGAEAVQEVLDLAKTKGVTAKEALELPMAKAYLESVKAEKAVADATPTGGRSPKAQPDKPIGEMNKEEHKAYHKKLVG